MSLKTTILCLSLFASVSAVAVLKPPICMELIEPLTMTPNGPQKIVIQGQITADSWIKKHWFEVNLIEGDESVCTTPLAGNIVFHMNTRMTQDHIVRDTFVKNDTSICIGTCPKSWGPEERIGGMPLAVGRPFELIIMCETNYFQIYIDGRHFVSYAFRIPLERVNYLQVLATATFKKIDVITPDVDMTSYQTERCNNINHIQIN